MLVLIVDNSIQIIERLEEIIGELESTAVVHGALSYEEAKKLLKEYNHDIVLLDIDLPGDQSLKLLAEIRMTGKETYVIVLFNYTDNYMIEKCKYYGVDFFIDKYYDFEKLYRLSNLHHLL